MRFYSKHAKWFNHRKEQRYINDLLPPTIKIKECLELTVRMHYRWVIYGWIQKVNSPYLELKTGLGGVISLNHFIEALLAVAHHLQEICGLIGLERGMLRSF